jgi:hypothetical protein
MAKKSSLTILKELSGIGLGAVALLYVCGYLVHVIYFRLLGVQVGAQPLTYLIFAGDYLVSILISIPQLFSLPGLYASKLLEVTIWPGIGLCLLSLLCILFRKRHESRWLSVAVCTLIPLSCLFIISSELKVLRAQNVLQPLTPNDVEKSIQIIADEKSKSMQERSKLISDAYEDHQSLGINGEGFAEWNRWFNPLNSNNRRERTAHYLAFLLLNVLFLATVSVGLWLRGTGKYARVVSREAVVGLLAVLLLLPCIYATLGRVFSLPVITLRLKPAESSLAKDRGSLGQKPENEAAKTEGLESASKEVVTHPVFLIFQDDTKIVVYDRLNLFQLKTVPLPQVLGISQLYNSSPFDDCALKKGQFVPCESKWLTESSLIIDY